MNIVSFSDASSHLLRRRLSTAAVIVTGAVLCTSFGGPLVLMNGSPSEPPGLYVRTFQKPLVGRIVAFRLPSAGLSYVHRAEPALRRRPLIKAVAAGPGDRVCTREGRLVVNGSVLASISGADRVGRTLPHWIACRALGADELFVFSDRVPNSFDSRYYGPVSRQAVLGVYRHVGAVIGKGA